MEYLLMFSDNLAKLSIIELSGALLVLILNAFVFYFIVLGVINVFVQMGEKRFIITTCLFSIITIVGCYAVLQSGCLDHLRTPPEIERVYFDERFC